MDFSKYTKKSKGLVSRRKKEAQTPFYQRTCVWARAVLAMLVLLLILSIIIVS